MFCFTLIFFLVPELLNHPKLLDAIWGVFLPLYQRSHLRHDPGCDPCTAPAFLLQHADGGTPKSMEGYPGTAMSIVTL